MITSFFIHNFRQFAELRMPSLARVNLFVGKNNVGKSALLEALQIYFGRMSGRVLLDVGSTRSEVWDVGIKSVRQASNADVIRHLFNGHKLPSSGELGIVVGPIDDEYQLQLSVIDFKRVESSEGAIQLFPIDSSQISLFDNNPVEDVTPFFVSLERGRIKRIFPIDRTVRHSRLSQSIVEEEEVFQVVPTKNINERTIAAWWDAVNLTDLEQEVVFGLQIINSSIIGVAFVENSSSSNSRIPLVRVRGQIERLPLSSMGDGVTRLFHIILALVNSKGGSLLIDEFENGLHWSIQEKVWNTVFQLAERLNVQVFATTHSRDCVKAFELSWERHQGEGMYYRLENDRAGNVQAQAYSLETLSDSLEADIETR